MDRTLKMVREFHTLFDISMAAEPIDLEDRPPAVEAELNEFVGRMTVLADDLHSAAEAHGANPLLLKLQLCQEELAELAEAMADGNMVAALDALCDLRYVLDGTTLVLGLGAVFNSAFVEVHMSNLTKLDENNRPIKNAAGRVMKPPHYSPPQLERFLNDYSF